MGIEGMPDFAQPLVEDGLTVLYPFQNGACTVYPEGLEMATALDGTPQFSLELVRGVQQYGVLAFALTARFRTAEALTAIRKQRRSASLQSAQFAGGLFR